MDVRGQRFTLDLDDYDEGSAGSSLQPTASPLDFVQDITERPVKPPTSPKLRPSTTGFPEHKKRIRISAFKQQRGPSVKDVTTTSQNAPAAPSSPASSQPVNTHGSSFESNERQQIDEENKMKLASMTDEEISEEKQELLAQLDPSLIQRLLQRANLDQGRGDTGTDSPTPDTKTTKEAEATGTTAHSEATSVPIPTGKPITAEKSIRFDDDAEPPNTTGINPSAIFPSSNPAHDQTPEIHFPTPPPLPDLDPSDPSFLENLHSKYFPTLPTDPSKLAWMAPIPSANSPADVDSPYYPHQPFISASSLRFNFRGGLMPPRIARAVPVSKGLHHHGEAPEAAGYTIPELARLARSKFPSQRCLAFQVLGRVLYRLGRGEWGDEGEEMVKGLWGCVEGGKVIETLEEAAGAEGGHQGSMAYATEALWLWRKGGGKRWKAA